MADRIFLRLDDKFALGADSLQWILYARARQDASMAKPRDWRAVSFVSSTKEILFRCIREAGCKPCAEARVALDGYPDTFEAWKAKIVSQRAAGTGHPEDLAAQDASRAYSGDDLTAETVLDGPEVALSGS